MSKKGCERSSTRTADDGAKPGGRWSRVPGGAAAKATPKEKTGKEKKAPKRRKAEEEEEPEEETTPGKRAALQAKLAKVRERLLGGGGYTGSANRLGKGWREWRGGRQFKLRAYRPPRHGYQDQGQDPREGFHAEEKTKRHRP